MNIVLHNAPRIGKNAKEQGAYSLIIDSNRPLAYPGEVIVLRLFVSGYGAISNPKIHILLPEGLCDEERSYLYHGLEPIQEGRLSKFGAKREKLLQNGTYFLNGIKHDGWDESTWMIDVANDVETPPILTETSQDRSFMELEIKIRQHSLWKYMNVPVDQLNQMLKIRLRPGRHPIQFVFTFFDSKQWHAEKVIYDLVLPNWYQRHPLGTWFASIILALVAVMVAVASFVVDWMALIR